MTSVIHVGWQDCHSTHHTVTNLLRKCGFYGVCKTFSHLFLTETMITQSQQFRGGQTSWVCWWGDSEQRHGPSATVGTGVTSDPWPHCWGSPWLAVSLALWAAWSQTLTLGLIHCDGCVTCEPWGQPSQPHTESTRWPHIGMFMWMCISVTHSIIPDV